MYKILHTFENQNGLIYNNVDYVRAVTEEEYISNNSAQASLFHFLGINSSITLTFATPIICYSEKCSMILSLCSIRKGNYTYNVKKDFNYKLKINNDNNLVFYIPTLPDFDQMQANITGIAEISSVEIIMTSENEDYLVISNVGIYQSVLPIDIYLGLKAELNRALANKYMFLGLVTTQADDLTMLLPNDIYLERYATIVISSIAGTEIHQIDEINAEYVSFLDLYDGKAIKYSHDDAEMRLYIPIVIGTSQREASFPSIVIWGADPEMDRFNSDIESVITAFEENRFKIQNNGECYKYTILINCHARHDEILQMMSTTVRYMLKRSKIWVNGFKIFVEQDGTAQQFDPTIPVEIEPQVQYRALVQIHEFTSEPKILPIATTINNRITIEGV